MNVHTKTLPKPRLAALETVAEDLPSIVRVEGLNVNLIGRVLAKTRATAYKDFKHEQQMWLDENLPPLLRATELLFERTIQEFGEDTARAVLLGSLLGGAVIRETIQVGVTQQAECLDNLVSWNIGVRGMRFDGTYSDETELTIVYGEDVAGALGEIRDPAARTICGMTISLALVPMSSVTS